MQPDKTKELEDRIIKLEQFANSLMNAAEVDPIVAKTILAIVGTPSLNDLTDVTITSPSSTEVLKYNGTEWVNAADAT